MHVYLNPVDFKEKEMLARAVKYRNKIDKGFTTFLLQWHLYCFLLCIVGVSWCFSCLCSCAVTVTTCAIN